MLLLESSLINWNFWWHFPLNAIYFLFFLGDLIIFLLFWFIRPKWEFNIRIIDILWSILIVTVLLPMRFFLTLPIVICIQFFVLIWPKQYLFDVSSEVKEEELDNTEILTKIKCVSCGASYAYNPKVISDNEVTCQNCGKSIRI